MSGERRTVQGELPDGVADRDQGYTHNPNPQDELEIQRARFAEQQRQLQQDRREAAEAMNEMERGLEEQYQAAQHDPAHEVFVPTQREEQATMDSATHADTVTDDQVSPGIGTVSAEVPWRMPPATADRRHDRD